MSIILQLLYGHEMKKKLRILVLTSSNAAVDIIARRLLYIREKLQKSGLNLFLTHFNVKSRTNAILFR